MKRVWLQKMISYISWHQNSLAFFLVFLFGLGVAIGHLSKTGWNEFELALFGLFLVLMAGIVRLTVRDFWRDQKLWKGRYQDAMDEAE